VHLGFGGYRANGEPCRAARQRESGILPGAAEHGEGKLSVETPDVAQPLKAFFVARMRRRGQHDQRPGALSEND
jgi:hypothetical protein